jgi:hypothetical protein
MVWSGIQQDDILFYLGVIDDLNDVLFWNAFIAVQGLLVLALVAVGVKLAGCWLIGDPVVIEADSQNVR